MVAKTVESVREIPVESVRAQPAAGPDALFVVVCLVAVSVRYLLLTAPGAPSGIDGGNWLSLGLSLIGHPVRSSSIVYPPVIPLVVTAAVNLLGAVRGIALVASVSSILPAVGAYVVLRPIRLGFSAVVLAALLVPLAATGEATAWGGYPQLAATGFAILALHALDHHLRAPTRRGALTCGLALALVLATSHFVGTIVALASGILVALHWVLSRRDGESSAGWRSWRLGAVALPCLPFVPLYAALGHAMRGGFQSRPSALRVTIGSLAANIDFAYRDVRILWRPLIVFAFLTPFVAGAVRRQSLWTIPTSLLAAMSLMLATTGEPRCLYLLPPIAVLTGGFWLDAIRRVPSTSAQKGYRLVAVVLTAGLAVSSVSGFHLFADQRDYYNILSPGVVDGIDWLRAQTPEKATVAVAALEDAPLGWWVEGLGHRRALSGSPLQWLYLADERARARAVNGIFESDFPDDTALDRARRAGADYLFVAKASDGFVLERADAFFSGHQDIVAFENDEVFILTVPGALVTGA